MSRTSTALQKLIEAMRANGVEPSKPSQIRGTGKWERFHVVGDKPGSKNGTVKYSDYKLPYASYRSVAGADNYFHWHSGESTGATEAELAVVARDVERDRRAGEARDARRHRKAARRAKRLWAEATDAQDDQPYLVAKGIAAHGTRQTDGALLVPYRDMDGKISTLLTIAQDGEDAAATFTKRYQKDGAKKRMFFQFGKAPRWSVVLAEGFATAATIHECTGMTSIDVGGRSNFMEVALQFRHRYPVLDIIIAADDDEAKAIKKQIPNGGVVEATRVALRVSGRVAVPTFGNRRPSTKRTDFNDMARCEGAKAVKAAIMNAKVPVPEGGRALASVDARSFVAEPLPPRKFLIRPWLPEQGVALVHGARESGKTHFGIAVLAALATGTDFLGWKVKTAVSVLYVDGEMHEADLQARVKLAIASTGGKQRAPWRLLPQARQPEGIPDLSRLEWREAIEREAAGSRVIVLDSISTLVNSEHSINDAASWTPIQIWMRGMKAKGHTILWVHHDGKGGQQLGTSTRETIVEASLHLVKKARLADGLSLSLTFAKIREVKGGEVMPMHLTFRSKPDGRYLWSVLAKDETPVSPANQADKEETLRMHKNGATVSEIAQKLRQSESNIRRWVKAANK